MAFCIKALYFVDATGLRIVNDQNIDSNYFSYIAEMGYSLLTSRPRIYRLEYFHGWLFLRPAAEANVHFEVDLRNAAVSKHYLIIIVRR